MHSFNKCAAKRFGNVRSYALKTLRHWFGPILITASIVGPSTVFADAIASKTQRIIQNAMKLCQGAGGSFSMQPNSITAYQFNPNDGIDQLTIVDESGFYCSSTATMFEGSAGSNVHLITSQDYLETYARGYEVVTAFHGIPLILFALHGVSCGEPGFKPCITVISIFEGKFVNRQ
jgi:hypothetical protein